MRAQFLGQGDPLEKEMATHSSLLAYKNPMERGAWQVTGHGVAKSRIGLSDWARTHAENSRAVISAAEPWLETPHPVSSCLTPCLRLGQGSQWADRVLGPKTKCYTSSLLRKSFPLSTPSQPTLLAIIRWNVSPREEAEPPETLSKFRAQHTDTQPRCLELRLCVMEERGKPDHRRPGGWFQDSG